MRTKVLIVRSWFTVVSVLTALAGGALAQAPFYQGKTLVIVVGTAPGGAGDHRTRALVPS
jgi:tripartite-type tricarboxylate transporter receptor subunit TctC